MPPDAQSPADRIRTEQDRLDKTDQKLDGKIDVGDTDKTKVLTETYIKKVDDFQARIRSARTKIDVRRDSRSPQWQAFEKTVDSAEKKLGDLLAGVSDANVNDLPKAKKFSDQVDAFLGEMNSGEKNAKPDQGNEKSEEQKQPSVLDAALTRIGASTEERSSLLIEAPKHYSQQQIADVLKRLGMLSNINPSLQDEWLGTNFDTHLILNQLCRGTLEVTPAKVLLTDDLERKVRAEWQATERQVRTSDEDIQKLMQSENEELRAANQTTVKGEQEEIGMNVVHTLQRLQQTIHDAKWIKGEHEENVDNAVRAVQRWQQTIQKAQEESMPLRKRASQLQLLALKLDIADARSTGQEQEANRLVVKAWEQYGPQLEKLDPGLQAQLGPALRTLRQNNQLTEFEKQLFGQEFTYDQALKTAVKEQRLHINADLIGQLELGKTFQVSADDLSGFPRGGRPRLTLDDKSEFASLELPNDERSQEAFVKQLREPGELAEASGEPNKNLPELGRSESAPTLRLLEGSHGTKASFSVERFSPTAKVGNQTKYIQLREDVSHDAVELHTIRTANRTYEGVEIDKSVMQKIQFAPPGMTLVLKRNLKNAQLGEQYTLPDLSVRRDFLGGENMYFQPVVWHDTLTADDLAFAKIGRGPEENEQSEQRGIDILKKYGGEVLMTASKTDPLANFLQQTIVRLRKGSLVVEFCYDHALGNWQWKEVERDGKQFREGLTDHPLWVKYGETNPSSTDKRQDQEARTELNKISDELGGMDSKVATGSSLTVNNGLTFDQTWKDRKKGGYSIPVSQAEKEHTEASRDVLRVLDRSPSTLGVRRIASTLQRPLQQLGQMLEAGAQGTKRESFVNFAQTQAKPLLKLMESDETARTVADAKSQLEILKQVRTNVANGPEDAKIQQQIAALTGMVDLIESGKMKEILSTILSDTEFSADTWAKLCTDEGLKVALTIAITVLVTTIVAFTTLSTFGAAAPLWVLALAGTAGGIIGSEAGAEAVFYEHQMLDPKGKYFHKRSLLGQWATTGKMKDPETGLEVPMDFLKDVAAPYLKEFAVSFVVNFATMGAGKVAGELIGTYLALAASGKAVDEAAVLALARQVGVVKASYDQLAKSGMEGVSKSLVLQCLEQSLVVLKETGKGTAIGAVDTGIGMGLERIDSRLGAIYNVLRVAQSHIGQVRILRGIGLRVLFEQATIKGDTMHIPCNGDPGSLLENTGGQLEKLGYQKVTNKNGELRITLPGGEQFSVVLDPIAPLSATAPSQTAEQIIPESQNRRATGNAKIILVEKSTAAPSTPSPLDAPVEEPGSTRAHRASLIATELVYIKELAILDANAAFNQRCKLIDATLLDGAPPLKEKQKVALHEAIKLATKEGNPKTILEDQMRLLREAGFDDAFISDLHEMGLVKVRALAKESGSVDRPESIYQTTALKETLAEAMKVNGQRSDELKEYFDGVPEDPTQGPYVPVVGFGLGPHNLTAATVLEKTCKGDFQGLFLNEGKKPSAVFSMFEKAGKTFDPDTLRHPKTGEVRNPDVQLMRRFEELSTAALSPVSPDSASIGRLLTLQSALLNSHVMYETKVTLVENAAPNQQWPGNAKFRVTLEYVNAQGKTQTKIVYTDVILDGRGAGSPRVPIEEEESRQFVAQKIKDDQLLHRDLQTSPDFQSDRRFLPDLNERAEKGILPFGKKPLDAEGRIRDFKTVIVGLGDTSYMIAKGLVESTSYAGDPGDPPILWLGQMVQSELGPAFAKENSTMVSMKTGTEVVKVEPITEGPDKGRYSLQYGTWEMKAGPDGRMAKGTRISLDTVTVDKVVFSAGAQNDVHAIHKDNPLFKNKPAYDPRFDEVTNVGKVLVDESGQELPYYVLGHGANWIDPQYLVNAYEFGPLPKRENKGRYINGSPDSLDQLLHRTKALAESLALTIDTILLDPNKRNATAEFLPTDPSMEARTNPDGRKTFTIDIPPTTPVALQKLSGPDAPHWDLVKTSFKIRIEEALEKLHIPKMSGNDQIEILFKRDPGTEKIEVEVRGLDPESTALTNGALQRNLQNSPDLAHYIDAMTQYQGASLQLEVGFGANGRFSPSKVEVISPLQYIEHAFEEQVIRYGRARDIPPVELKQIFSRLNRMVLKSSESAIDNSLSTKESILQCLKKRTLSNTQNMTVDDAFEKPGSGSQVYLIKNGQSEVVAAFALYKPGENTKGIEYLHGNNILREAGLGDCVSTTLDVREVRRNDGESRIGILTTGLRGKELGAGNDPLTAVQMINAAQVLGKINSVGQQSMDEASLRPRDISIWTESHEQLAALVRDKLLTEKQRSMLENQFGLSHGDARLNNFFMDKTGKVSVSGYYDIDQTYMKKNDVIKGQGTHAKDLLTFLADVEKVGKDDNMTPQEILHLKQTFINEYIKTIDKNSMPSK